METRWAQLIFNQENQRFQHTCLSQVCLPICIDRLSDCTYSAYLCLSAHVSISRSDLWPCGKRRECISGHCGQVFWYYVPRVQRSAWKKYEMLIQAWRILIRLRPDSLAMCYAMAMGWSICSSDFFLTLIPLPFRFICPKAIGIRLKLYRLNTWARESEWWNIFNYGNEHNGFCSSNKAVEVQLT